MDVIALALRDGAKHSRVPSERILQLMGHRQRWKYPLLVRGGEPDVQVWNIGRIGEEGLRYSERCGMKHMVVGTKRAQSRPRYRTLVRLPRSRGGVVKMMRHHYLHTVAPRRRLTGSSGGKRRTSSMSSSMSPSAMLVLDWGIGRGSEAKRN